MKRIVVDASVVVAALHKNGSVRDVLLNAEDASFCAPAYLADEVTRLLAEVVARVGLPAATVEAVLSDLLGSIDLVPSGAYANGMSRARRLAAAADAVGDEDYVALALSLDAPVWTLDHDFRRIPGLKTLTTKEVDELR